MNGDGTEEEGQQKLRKEERRNEGEEVEGQVGHRRESKKTEEEEKVLKERRREG